jgi:NAD-dependent dihydropyrimidine dehydrogenase PreA subunit
MTEALTIDLSLCDGCGMCVESCPTDVLRVDEAALKVRIAYPNDCQSCYLCQDDCPQSCIAVGHSSENPRRRSIYDILEIA